MDQVTPRNVEPRLRGLELALVVALEVALIQGCAILWPPSHWVKTSHVIRPEPEWPVGSAGQPFVHKGRRP